MRSPATSSTARLGFLPALALIIGCGGSVQGTYSGSENTFFDSMTLRSGGKAEITFAGMTKEGTFEVEDDRVKITVGGDTQIFTIRDDGCLAGGGLIGTYCKGGQRAAE